MCFPKFNKKTKKGNISFFNKECRGSYINLPAVCTKFWSLEEEERISGMYSIRFR